MTKRERARTAMAMATVKRVAGDKEDKDGKAMAIVTWRVGEGQWQQQQGWQASNGNGNGSGNGEDGGGQ